MYLLITLFFISLIGIIIMIGRKLKLAGSGQAVDSGYEHPFVPHFQKVKDMTIENAKKYGHLSLVKTLRLYIRSSNILKAKYELAKIKLKNINRKKGATGEPEEKAEVSKFLKLISDYKQKIREIKHKIHEEEKNS